MSDTTLAFHLYNITSVDVTLVCDYMVGSPKDITSFVSDFCRIIIIAPARAKILPFFV
ncbi:hypothetical protein [Prevotellamassilia timonensis]|uniref:hypothetical protein n=1 Tax=Prevotellamassilia timonensis TaxID=1852370 RepID=UPI004027CB6B